MATIKKYNGSTWENTIARKYETKSEIIVPPTTIYTDGTAITSYTIKGNTVQNGTPTPSNPVDVNGVGVRTENLFDGTFTVGYYINATTGLPATTNDPRMTTLVPIDVTEYDSVTFNFVNGTNYILNIMYSTLNNGTLIKREAALNAPLTIDTSTATQLYLCVYPPDRTKPIAPDSISSVMLNVGSTALPYEPYGFKIPISSGGVTTNIYLGSTQTIRQISKLVLTGTENWEDRPNYTYADRFVLQSTTISRTSTEICTHFTVEYSSQQTYPYLWINNGEQIIINYSAKGTTTLAQFKQWLADQYTNGTPVIIYYVLATAETGIVNEPLMKIGDYADTLSNATAIPTTEGANSITVDTTVQPTEFTATWTGWHDASVKEYTGGINIFDGTTSATNRRISTGTGGTYAADGYSVSNYISIEPNVRYYINTDYYSYYALYDSNNQYIYGSQAKVDSPTSDAYSNVRYIKFDFKTTDISTVELSAELHWK